MIPTEVATVAGAFCDAVDERSPDLLEGLYLHGSLGFGEWFAGRSDIDFVAVLSRPADETLTRMLEQVHADLQTTFPVPSFDGMHLTYADLAADPALCPERPCTLGGHWEDWGRVDINPVTWHELARHGVHVRGPALGEVELWTDRQVLRHYTHDNLAGYWQDTAEGLAQFPAEAAKPEMVAWMVLGTSRLHHLLRTDELTSKSGAGVYALEEFGTRWRSLLTEALCWRERGVLSGAYDGREGMRASDTIEFSAMVVETGLAIPV